MSKATNPTTESSVTCGFFNSLNGDRKYDSNQMSSLFDGIIRDGIFASIGDCFVVKAGTGRMITVGTGKAWFNKTWTQNDATLPVECEVSEVLLDRIDAVVIEVDTSDSVRDNFIKVIKGTPSSSPSRPTLENTNSKHQYALCYIYRKAGNDTITQAEITNIIGTAETPFVTGILQTISLDELLGQWQAELDQFIDSEKKEAEKLITQISDEFGVWTDSEKNTILSWFNNMKGQLSSDAAVNLQLQIDDNKKRHMLVYGLEDGKKKLSEDGKTITTTDANGYVYIKEFNDDFSVCTGTLKNPSGSVIGTLTKTFSTDGKVINTELKIIQ